ncbi:hypothetical protein, partial [Streptomyces calidiresistens]
MSKQSPIPPADGGAAPERRPEPRPIRFYGTSWVDHSRGYTPRRFALGLGAMLLAALGALALRLGYEGLRINETADWLTMLVVVAFAICSAIAFTRTWAGWNREGAGADDPSFRSIKAIGFLGLLLAYALRSGIEAPHPGNWSAAPRRRTRICSGRRAGRVPDSSAWSPNYGCALVPA